MTPRRMRRLINLWPPLVFSGIRVSEWSDDWRSAAVQLRLRWYNRNYVGTHFGGSLFSMTDPIYVIMLSQLLGRGYVVWDKAASIDFISPGRGVVTARFHLTEERFEEVKAATDGGEKYLPEFRIDVTDEAGELVATVLRTLYVRKKRPVAASTGNGVETSVHPMPEA